MTNPAPVPLLPLPRRQLGTTGLSVSTLGLGTVKFGRADGVKYPKPFTIPTDSEARDLLAAAHEMGINLIDTAPAYGPAEERLGSFLSGQRDQWIIVTKVGETFEQGASTFDFSPAAIIASVQRSLIRLRTDILDVVLLHSDGLIEEDLVNTGVLDALRSCKSSGMTRAIGASTKTLAGALHAVAHCDVVMLTLNPNHRDDLPAIAAAHGKGVGVLVKKAFGSGHLAAEHAGRQACMELALTTPGVSSVILGTISPAHLLANAHLAAPFA